MNTHKSHHSPQDSHPKHMCYYLNPVGVRDEYPGDRRNKRMLFRRHKTWRNHESVEYNVKPLRMQPFWLGHADRCVCKYPEKLLDAARSQNANAFFKQLRMQLFQRIMFVEPQRKTKGAINCISKKLSRSVQMIVISSKSSMAFKNTPFLPKTSPKNPRSAPSTILSGRNHLLPHIRDFLFHVLWHLQLSDIREVLTQDCLSAARSSYPGVPVFFRAESRLSRLVHNFNDHLSNEAARLRNTLDVDASQ